MGSYLMMRVVYSAIMVALVVLLNGGEVNAADKCIDATTFKYQLTDLNALTLHATEECTTADSKSCWECVSKKGHFIKYLSKCAVQDVTTSTVAVLTGLATATSDDYTCTAQTPCTGTGSTATTTCKQELTRLIANPNSCGYARTGATDPLKNVAESSTGVTVKCVKPDCVYGVGYNGKVKHEYKGCKEECEELMKDLTTEDGTKKVKCEACVNCKVTGQKPVPVDAVTASTAGSDSTGSTKAKGTTTPGAGTKATSCLVLTASAMSAVSFVWLGLKTAF